MKWAEYRKTAPPVLYCLSDYFDQSSSFMMHNYQNAHTRIEAEGRSFSESYRSVAEDMIHNSGQNVSVGVLLDMKISLRRMQQMIRKFDVNV